MQRAPLFIAPPLPPRSLRRTQTAKRFGCGVDREGGGIDVGLKDLLRGFVSADSGGVRLAEP